MRLRYHQKLAHEDCQKERYWQDALLNRRAFLKTGSSLSLLAALQNTTIRPLPPQENKS